MVKPTIMTKTNVFEAINKIEILIEKYLNKEDGFNLETLKHFFNEYYDEFIDPIPTVITLKSHVPAHGCPSKTFYMSVFFVLKGIRTFINSSSILTESDEVLFRKGLAAAYKGFILTGSIIDLMKGEFKCKNEATTDKRLECLDIETLFCKVSTSKEL